MSIYLAWSMYKFIAVFVYISIFSIFMVWISKRFNFPNGAKASLIFAIPACLITLLMAFNIGDRQQELGRSSFNASAPESVDKIESQRQDIQSVKDSFEKAVKRTN